MSSKYIHMKMYVLRTKISAHSFLTSKENLRYEKLIQYKKKMDENIIFKVENIYLHS